ncbi:PRTRC system ThiF family protein [Aliidiomarina quisquiliarum]|uniref:PRTRC system ThiF family protein n=1 Tax=Aliidiomarina quisquiliarum TaxID=2938947 RepID=UPI00208F03C5|nr:PRTRC system ThiF family protein [Aliidiomarina quisquiliarum]MCO4319980.1 PRTRC system ThiF family protein [Aliidiomarina quisquiliarum]
MNTMKAPQHFLEQFMRDEPLSVHVVGAGGTGSCFLQKLIQLHSTLVRLGAAGLDITVFDDDTVSETNIGRQAFYSMDVGLPKAKVLIERYNAFTGVDWSYSIERYCPTRNQAVMPDVLVTCVDNPQTRVQIGQYFKDKDFFKTLLWLDGGNDKDSGQVVMGMYPKKGCDDDQRVPSIYDLFTESLESNEYEPTDSCSHEEAINKQDFGINDQIATQMIQILWRLIRHGEAEYHGVFIDLKSGEHNPLPLNPLNWQMLGYVA